MTSFLIIHKNPAIRQEYAASLAKKEHIDPFDITTIELETSLGIEDVRTIQKKIFLKPFRGDTKATIIYNAHTASIEAQNALLKLLEEPPAHTILILTAQNKQSFLPTILSRCTIIELDTTDVTITDEQKNQLRGEFLKICTDPIGAKLKKAADLANEKTDALTWIMQMMEYMRTELVINYSLDYITYLKDFQKTYTLIQSTNVSTRFALEDLLLHLNT